MLRPSSSASLCRLLCCAAYLLGCTPPALARRHLASTAILTASTRPSSNTNSSSSPAGAGGTAGGTGPGGSSGAAGGSSRPAGDAGVATGPGGTSPPPADYLPQRHWRGFVLDVTGVCRAACKCHACVQGCMLVSRVCAGLHACVTAVCRAACMCHACVHAGAGEAG